MCTKYNLKVRQWEFTNGSAMVNTWIDSQAKISSFDVLNWLRNAINGLNDM